jgi:hypothetical protein
METMLSCSFLLNLVCIFLQDFNYFGSLLIGYSLGELDVELNVEIAVGWSFWLTFLGLINWHSFSRHTMHSLWVDCDIKVQVALPIIESSKLDWYLGESISERKRMHINKIVTLPNKVALAVLVLHQLDFKR